jgi:hypothetical protein
MNLILLLLTFYVSYNSMNQLVTHVAEVKHNDVLTHFC